MDTHPDILPESRPPGLVALDELRAEPLIISVSDGRTLSKYTGASFLQDYYDHINGRRLPDRLRPELEAADQRDFTRFTTLIKPAFVDSTDPRELDITDFGAAAKVELQARLRQKGEVITLLKQLKELQTGQDIASFGQLYGEWYAQEKPFNSWPIKNATLTPSKILIGVAQRLAEPVFDAARQRSNEDLLSADQKPPLDPFSAGMEVFDGLRQVVEEWLANPRLAATKPDFAAKLGTMIQSACTANFSVPEIETRWLRHGLKHLYAYWADTGAPGFVARDPGLKFRGHYTHLGLDYIHRRPGDLSRLLPKNYDDRMLRDMVVDIIEDSLLAVTQQSTDPGTLRRAQGLLQAYRNKRILNTQENRQQIPYSAITQISHSATRYINNQGGLEGVEVPRLTDDPADIPEALLRVLYAIDPRLLDPEDEGAAQLRIAARTTAVEALVKRTENLKFGRRGTIGEFVVRLTEQGLNAKQISEKIADIQSGDD